MLGCAAFAQTPATAPKSKATKSAAPKAGTAKSTTPAKAAAKGTAPVGNLLNPLSLKLKSPSIYVVKLETTKGDVTIRVKRAWAPLAAERFYNLVKAGFYDNCYFFRTLDFMAQTGISSRPEVARVWEDKIILDERPIESNKRGMVTFAAASTKNSRTTQFFINKLDRNNYLDASGFAPFGQVLEGMEVVDKLYTGYEEAPSQGTLAVQGEAYVKRYFPRLDKIIKATVIAIPEP
jgi:peptidyl-prolyl cis-trans isomerase A (cyclophilin A)